MQEQLKVDEIVKKNPKVDSTQMADALKVLKELEGVDSFTDEYRLVLPYTRRTGPPIQRKHPRSR